MSARIDPSATRRPAPATRRPRRRALAARALSILLAALLCVPAAGLASAASAAGQPVAVPSVVGLDVPTAKSQLTSAGFGVQVSGPDTTTAKVVSQDPTGQAEAGSTVTITTQEQLVPVPTVLDMTVPAAQAKLQAAGFPSVVVGDATETSLVIAQNPQGQALPGVTITLTGKEFAQPEEATVSRIDLLAYTTDAHSQWVNQLGTTAVQDGGTAYRLNDGIKDKGGKIRLMVQATWSDSRVFKQSDAGWLPLSSAGDNIKWTTSDASIATVDNQGVVTAVADGEITITATAPNGTTSSMTISVIGQSGAYVTGAKVLDEDGNECGSTYIDVTSLDTALQFYVRLSLSDGTTVSNCPGAPDCTPDATQLISTTCSWSIESSDVGSVNAQSGFFVPKADGRTKVQVTATGGDPNVNRGVVTATVFINVNTGKWDNGPNAPSDSLTIEAEYESMPGVVGVSRTYSISELQSAQNVRVTYSLTRNSNGTYVTDTADGIYLTTLLSMVGVNSADVKYFQFAANDGANPGNVSASFLFATRYYYPYANFGSDEGKVAVQPMLAFADSWKEGGTCEPSTELTETTRLRLLFGSTTMGDNATMLSLKYINTMRVILTGNPPDGWGDGGTTTPTDPPTDPPENPDNNQNGDPGNHANSGDGADPDATGTGGETAGPDVSGSGYVGFQDVDAAGGSPDAEERPDATGDAADASTAPADAESQQDPSQNAQRPDRQIYEMLSSSTSNVDLQTLDNPFAPFAVPAAVGAVGAGALASGIRYRRLLDLPRHAEAISHTPA